jgi:hypothetical protein
MPWKVRKPTGAETGPDWMRPYCEEFLQTLGDQGYVVRDDTNLRHVGPVAFARSSSAEDSARESLSAGRCRGRMPPLSRRCTRTTWKFP